MDNNFSEKPFVYYKPKFRYNFAIIYNAFNVIARTHTHAHTLIHFFTFAAAAEQPKHFSLENPTKVVT